MGERLAYYDRIAAAEMYPDNFCSTISDGMAQIHCQLPWFGNQITKAHVNQHLQGNFINY
jgi:hypothetical protein